MKPELQRVKIAEACGWKMLPRRAWLHKRTPKNPHPTGTKGSDVATEIPDYLGDLNAMHEAIMSLDIVSRREFSCVLRCLLEDELPGDHYGDEFTLQNATAPQRAEAFLRTLNLWTPEPLDPGS